MQRILQVGGGQLPAEAQEEFVQRYAYDRHRGVSSSQSKCAKYSSRMSSRPKRNMASRSSPRPHARTGAEQPSGSVTSGRNTPAPPISNQSLRASIQTKASTDGSV